MKQFIDSVLGKPFCIRNERGLNCLGLVAAYYNLIGVCVPEYKVKSMREIANAFAIAFAENSHGFIKIENPVNGCLVLFINGKRRHCGIFFDGNILHSTIDAGVISQKLSDISGFKKKEFMIK